MRRHRQLVLYQSILQALREPGCPFCRLLKEFQADCLQNRVGDDMQHLCNFHVWGLAAVQEALVAAQIFMKLVDEAVLLPGGVAVCDICDRIGAEEDLRMREFVSCINRPDVLDWLKSGAVLCIPHGLKLRRSLPPVLASRIDAIVESYRCELKEDLKYLRDDPEPQSDRTGWGAVGRAAEFLVCQRGLRA